MNNRIKELKDNFVVVELLDFEDDEAKDILESYGGQLDYDVWSISKENIQDIKEEIDDWENRIAFYSSYDDGRYGEKLTEKEVFKSYLKDPSKRKFTLKTLSTFSMASDEQKAQFEEEFKNELRDKFGDITDFDKIDFRFTKGFSDGDSCPRIGFISFWLKTVENPDPTYFKNSERGSNTYTEGNQAFADEITAIAEECLVKVFNKDPANENLYAMPRETHGYSQLQEIDFYEVRDADMQDRFSFGKDDLEFDKEFTQPLIKYGVKKIGKILDEEAQSRGWDSWDEFVKSSKFKAWSEKQYDRFNRTPFIAGSTKERLVNSIINREFKGGWYKDKTVEEFKNWVMKNIDSNAEAIEDNRRNSIWYHTAIPIKTVSKSTTSKRKSNTVDANKKYYVRFEYLESGEHWDDRYGPYTAKEALEQYKGLKKEYKYAISEGTVAITLENRMGRELQPDELKEYKREEIMMNRRIKEADEPVERLWDFPSAEKNFKEFCDKLQDFCDTYAKGMGLVVDPRGLNGYGADIHISQWVDEYGQLGGYESWLDSDDLAEWEELYRKTFGEEDLNESVLNEARVGEEDKDIIHNTDELAEVLRKTGQFLTVEKEMDKGHITAEVNGHDELTFDIKIRSDSHKYMMKIFSYGESVDQFRGATKSELIADIKEALSTLYNEEE